LALSINTIAEALSGNR